MADFNTEELGQDLDAEVFNEDETQKISVGQKIKPYLGTIIKVIILLAIIGVLYYFFFYRYTTVNFTVFNYETNSNETTTILLMKDGKTITIDTDTDIKLLSGDYSVSIEGELSKKYLKTKIVSIDKSMQNSSINIDLYPEWVTNISEFKISGPATVYTNQDVTLDVSLKNKGNPLTITLLGNNDLNSILDTDKTQEIKQGENKFQIHFKVLKKQNEKINGSIYIDLAKNLSQTKTNEFSATVKTAPKIKITNSKTVFETSAGQELKITFDLSNTSQEEINNLNFSINPSTANMDLDILKSYITQSPKDINIAKNNNTSADLILAIPIQTYFEGKKEIIFDAIFSNSYTSATKKITINYTAPNIIIPKLTDFGNITAGSNSEKIVTIENTTKYSIAVKESKLNITSQTLNLEDSISRQISFDVPEKLEPGKTDIKIIAIIPPLFVTDEFTAELQLSTDIGDLKIPLKFEITGINVKLEPKLNQRYTFVFTGTEGMEQSEKKSYDISIKNAGNVDLNNININIGNCSDLVSVSLATNITINKNETIPLFLILAGNKPKTSLPEEKICSFDLSYIDPRTDTMKIDTTQFIIS